MRELVSETCARGFVIRRFPFFLYAITPCVLRYDIAELLDKSSAHAHGETGVVWHSNTSHETQPLL